MRYGAPYKGSKNAIATKILSVLPTAENFYDLFCGGCAVTHAAVLMGKYKNYFVNDINGDIVTLFCNAVSGVYTNETRWISREDFFALKDTDPYVRYCWSFGNNGRDYIYSKEIEPWKKAYHYARVLGDFSVFDSMGVAVPHDVENIRRNIKANATTYAQQYRDWCAGHGLHPKGSSRLRELQSLESLQRLERLERLERLQSLESLQRLQSLQRLERLERLNEIRDIRLQLHKTIADYSTVQILPNSVIYCDIPYAETNGYDTRGKGNSTFDHAAFYDWCAQQTEPVFVSSYDMPSDRFVSVAEWKKQSLIGTHKAVTERLYVPLHQYEKYLADNVSPYTLSV